MHNKTPSEKYENITTHQLFKRSSEKTVESCDIVQYTVLCTIVYGQNGNISKFKAIHISLHFVKIHRLRSSFEFFFSPTKNPNYPENDETFYGTTEANVHGSINYTP